MCDFSPSLRSTAKPRDLGATEVDSTVDILKEHEVRGEETQRPWVSD